ncbi:MAG: universal stress protein [Planctomycetales bacterium]|nr:universal stress protein [Planctomycetales bacterium]
MNWFEGKTVVVPIDFGELSQQAVDEALNMVFRPTDIHVVHVAPDLLSMSPPVGWVDIDDTQRATNIETAFRKEFSESKYHGIAFKVMFGDPGHLIAQHAEEIGADVIVMPSHGRSGLKRLMLGSVAERVLRFAHCPVLVLRQ